MSGIVNRGILADPAFQAVFALLPNPLRVEAFGRSLRNGTEYCWQLEQSRGTQALIDSVFAKVREG